MAVVLPLAIQTPNHPDYYESDSTHPTCEVKQGQVGSVLAWGTRPEVQMLYFLLLLFSWVFVMLMSILVHIYFSQDTMRIHHISLLNMIIARVIYPMERAGPPQIT